MQLLISVEPDTRRVPNLPPPAPRSSRSYLCFPSPSLTPSNALRPTRPPASAPLAALYRRATLCPFRGGGWRRVTSLSKNGRCRLSLSRSASLSCAPSPSFHLLPALPASSPLFFSLLLSLRFLPFFSRCFSFSPFLSAGSVSPFLHLASALILFSAIFSLSRSYGRRSCFPLARGHSAGPSALSLRHGCLYSVFHCGSHTCPVAGWPSLACRRRRARDWERGTRVTGRLQSVRWGEAARPWREKSERTK